jgi:hypothetical protein
MLGILHCARPTGMAVRPSLHQRCWIGHPFLLHFSREEIWPELHSALRGRSYNGDAAKSVDDIIPLCCIDVTFY